MAVGGGRVDAGGGAKVLWGRREKLSVMVEFLMEQQSVVRRPLSNRGTSPGNAHALRVGVLLGKGKGVQELCVRQGQQARARRGGRELLQDTVGDLQGQGGDRDVEGDRLQVRPGAHVVQRVVLLLPLLLGDEAQDLQVAVAVSAYETNTTVRLRHARTPLQRACTSTCLCVGSMGALECSYLCK